MVRQRLRRGSHVFLPHSGFSEFEPGYECHRSVQSHTAPTAAKWYRSTGTSSLHVRTHSGQWQLSSARWSFSADAPALCPPSHSRRLESDRAAADYTDDVISDRLRRQPRHSQYV